MVVVVMKIRIVFLSSYKCDWWQELRYSPVADVLWRNRLKLLLESLHFINNNQMDKNDARAKIRPMLRDATRNFSRQGRFLGMRPLW